MYVQMTNAEGEVVIWFSPNYNVNVKPPLMKEPPERIIDLLKTALFYNENEYLKDAAQGARGPLMKFGFMCPVSFEDFLTALEEIRVLQETKRAKRRLTAYRRAEFQGERARLMLRLIDSGVPYVCKALDCGQTDGLTLDHIEPISRGGTDDLTNLQFLCKSHNSQKGDRVAGAAA